MWISSFLPSHCGEEQTIPAEDGDGGSQAAARYEGGGRKGEREKVAVKYS